MRREMILRKEEEEDFFARRTRKITIATKVTILSQPRILAALATMDTTTTTLTPLTTKAAQENITSIMDTTILTRMK